MTESVPMGSGPRDADFTPLAEASSPLPGAHEVHHRLEQAPIRAIEINTTRVVVIGTALFALAAVVLAVLHRPLQDTGSGWWLWVALTGTLLGAYGIWYCRRRS